MKTYKINISGVVQGIGFRPFIFNNAVKYNLRGYCKNTCDGIEIEVEGKKENIDSFIKFIKSNFPPLALIEDFFYVEVDYQNFDKFEIISSDEFCDHNLLISPDIAMCKECENEIKSYTERRKSYPFTNCTNCGPRFTIIKDTPYDRDKTSMNKFEMCYQCKKEYEDSSDRRFHAQPIACKLCGPKLFLYDNNRNLIQCDVIDYTKDLIKKGKIIAIKGIGGFHLVCIAKSIEAVMKLRLRKHRDFKPFALMARDLDIVKSICELSEAEKNYINDERKPIVLLKKKKNITFDTTLISKDNDLLGIMLPYTPVHSLLFDEEIDLLIMTSGNYSDEPIYYKDNEALEKLNEIADFFVTNNRDIVTRVDDSIVRVINDSRVMIRRSRGFVPSPINIKNIINSKNTILACGAQLKNTFTLLKNNNAFISHHIGDLDNYETYKSFEEGIKHYLKLFNADYNVCCFDIHPEYLSSKYAMIFTDKRLLPIQHHKAHVASCMAENGINEEVLGIAFDGAGIGEDGNIWGGEFFIGEYTTFKHFASFENVDMPGGDIAAKEIWRMTISYLFKYFGENIDLDILNLDNFKVKMTIMQIQKKLNTFSTSSTGRLFDAVSYLLGMCKYSNYEGQAAILLENIVNNFDKEIYNYSIEYNNLYSRHIISLKKLFKEIISDIKDEVSKSTISTKFHNTIVDIIMNVSNLARVEYNIKKVVLSGGVFQNKEILTRTIKKLKDNNFEVYWNKEIPTNDGGISFGQAVIGAKILEKEGV